MISKVLVDGRNRHRDRNRDRSIRDAHNRSGTDKVRCQLFLITREQIAFGTAQPVQGVKWESYEREVGAAWSVIIYAYSGFRGRILSDFLCVCVWDTYGYGYGQDRFIVDSAVMKYFLGFDTTSP
jgi:hypothetical protein